MDNQNPLEQMRSDWYQTEVAVVVTLLIKNIKQEYLTVDIDEKTLSVSIKFPDIGEKHLRFNLLHKVVPDASSYKIMSTKIEIKLKKLEGFRWDKLEGSEEQEIIKPIVPVSSVSDKPPSYPTSKGTDWSAIEKEIKKQEAKDKAEGDELNNLFQKIYGEGSDEVKKAMNKSFMESGGTVLSTNWKEIAAKKVDVKPPDGLEWKKWE